MERQGKGEVGEDLKLVERYILVVVLLGLVVWKAYYFYGG